MNLCSLTQRHGVVRYLFSVPWVSKESSNIWATQPSSEMLALSPHTKWWGPKWNPENLVLIQTLHLHRVRSQGEENQCDALKTEGRSEILGGIRMEFFFFFKTSHFPEVISRRDVICQSSECHSPGRNTSWQPKANWNLSMTSVMKAKWWYPGTTSLNNVWSSRNQKQNFA